MAEKHVLSAPVVVPPVTEYEVTSIHLDRLMRRVNIEVRSNTGVQITKGYDGDVAITLIKQLNTANLTTKSLERRVLERLAADGVFPAGIINGTPD